MSCSCIDNDIDKIVNDDYLNYGCDRLDGTLRHWEQHCSASECKGQTNNFRKYKKAHDKAKLLCDTADREIGLLADISHEYGVKATLLLEEPKVILKDLEDIHTQLIQGQKLYGKVRSVIKTRLENESLSKKSRELLVGLKAYFEKNLPDLVKQYEERINKLKVEESERKSVRGVIRRVTGKMPSVGKIQFIHELKRAQEKYSTVELKKLGAHLGLSVLPKTRNDLAWLIAIQLASVNNQ